MRDQSQPNGLQSNGLQPNLERLSLVPDKRGGQVDSYSLSKRKTQDTDGCDSEYGLEPPIETLHDASADSGDD
jgi:hypothetical protein